MYIDSALIYIMVARIRNAIWPPPPQFFLHRRAALTTNSNGTQSAHKWKGWGYGLDNLLISMSGCQWCRYIRDAKIEKFDTKWNANERLRKGQELKIYQTVPVPKTYVQISWDYSFKSSRKTLARSFYGNMILQPIGRTLMPHLRIWLQCCPCNHRHEKGNSW
jgi:hypothetical protein